MPISGLKGDGVKEPLSDKCEWYKGKTLFETLNSLELKVKKPEDPLKFPIIAIYYDSGKLYLIGKVETGTLKIGD